MILEKIFYIFRQHLSGGESVMKKMTKIEIISICEVASKAPSCTGRIFGYRQQPSTLLC